MSRSHTVRHNLPVALLLSALLLVLPTASATAASQEAGYIQVRPRVCPSDWREGTWHVRRLIRCAAFRYHVPGGAAKALAIADRESHFDPGAYNRYSGAAGIYQHLTRYWPGRAYTFGFRGYSAFNARANIIVTMRMVRRYGWSPWGG